MLEGLADIVEHLGEVALHGLDGEGLTHAGGFEDIVDETEEHVAVVTDDTNELHTLCWGFHHLKDITEADDGIEGSADLVGHIGEEGGLEVSGVFGTGSFLL